MPDTDDPIQNEPTGTDGESGATGQTEDLESKVDRLLADMDAACEQLKSELEAHDQTDDHSLDEVMAAGGALDDEGQSVTAQEGDASEDLQQEAQALAEAETEASETSESAVEPDPDPSPDANAPQVTEKEPEAVAPADDEPSEPAAAEPAEAEPEPSAEASEAEDGDAAQLDEQLAEMLDAAVAEERAATEESEPDTTEAAAALDDQLDAELEGLAEQLDAASDEELAAEAESAVTEAAAEETPKTDAPAAGVEAELDDELAELAEGLGDTELEDEEPSVASAPPEQPAASEPEPVAEAAPAKGSDEPTHEVVTADDTVPGRDAGAEEREPKPSKAKPAAKPKRELEPLRAEGRFKYAILAWLYAKRYAPPVAGFVMRQMQAAWRQAEPKLGLAVRTLSKPLEDRPKIVRDSVGWLALWTMFNAVVVWGFVLFIRKPPAPPVTTAPVQLREDQIPQDPGRMPESSAPESTS